MLLYDTNKVSYEQAVKVMKAAQLHHVLPESLALAVEELVRG